MIGPQPWESRPSRSEPWRAVMALAAGEMRHTLSQPRLLVFLVLLPVVFSTVFALFQTNDVGALRVIVRTPDTPLAQMFVSEVRRDGSQVEAYSAHSINLLARNERDVLLTLPRDFDAQLKSRRPVSVLLVASSSSARAREVNATLNGAAARLQVRLSAGALVPHVAPSAPAGAATGVEARVLKLLSRPVLDVRVEAAATSRLSRNERPSGSNQTTPGMMLMFALLFGAQTGLSLHRDRMNGTLARLRAAPISAVAAIAGKLTGNAVILCIQLAAMVAFGSLALGVHWGNVLVLGVPAVTFAIMASAFGAFCAGITRSSQQLSALSILLVTVMAALGGMWWPLELTPAWMQGLAHALPTYWGMRSFQDVMLRGAGLVGVAGPVFILLGFSALFLVIGARAYRYE